MDKISIRFDIDTTDAAADLGVRVLLDSTIVYEKAHVTENIAFAHDLSDDDGDHVLEIELFGKRPEHTVINEAGEIVKDAMLAVSNIMIDDLDIFKIVNDVGVYHHSFNGTADPFDDKFFGDMGCNGTVKVKFSTPVYLWLLENM